MCGLADGAVKKVYEGENLMVITILVPVKNPEVMISGLKPFLKSVEDCGYPKGQIEVVFLVVSAEDKGLRTFPGSPIVKIRYYKDCVYGLNDGIEKALGDLIVFAEIRTRFAPGKLTTAVRCFSQRDNLRLFLADGWQMMARWPILFLDDLFCLKTPILMWTLDFGKEVVGPWGKLHRKEVLRFLYKMDQVRFKDKLKILWGCR